MPDLAWILLVPGGTFWMRLQMGVETACLI